MVPYVGWDSVRRSQPGERWHVVLLTCRKDFIESVREHPTVEMGGSWTMARCCSWASTCCQDIARRSRSCGSFIRRTSRPAARLPRAEAAVVGHDAEPLAGSHDEQALGQRRRREVVHRACAGRLASVGDPAGVAPNARCSPAPTEGGDLIQGSVVAGDAAPDSLDSSGCARKPSTRAGS